MIKMSLKMRENAQNCGLLVKKRDSRNVNSTASSAILPPGPVLETGLN